MSAFPQERTLGPLPVYESTPLNLSHALRFSRDIPTPDEIKRIIHAVKGRWRPLLLTAIFTGLRASELRGLRWEDVDLDKNKSELHIRQRADRFNNIGAPKTAAGERTVPLPPMVANTLREWKLQCPRKDGKLWLVFPNGEGNVEWHTNLVLRCLQPTLIRAGVTDPAGEAKYTGMHALRHFYASWCASIGLTTKDVQTRMGHSNIAVTMDTYTHIFPNAAEDSQKLKNYANLNARILTSVKFSALQFDNVIEDFARRGTDADPS
jgi:integrase